MGSKPLRVKHVTQLTSSKHRYEKSLKEALISTTENPNCELLLSYYASEVSMNKKIKSLFEVIFAHDENEIFEINLSHINIDVKSAYHLKIILQYFSNIRHLKLSNCNLNSKNLKRLSRSLPSFSKLSEFYFDSNVLDLEGFKLLTQFFRYWPRLNVLNLNGSGLEVEGFEVLSKNLQLLIELNELFLSNNQGDDDVADGLALALEKLNYLECFEMAKNGLRFDGICQIVLAFQGRVKKANFEGNLVSDKEKFVLRSRFKMIEMKV